MSARAAGLKQVLPNRISWTLGAAGWRGTSYGIDTYPTGQHAAVIGPTRSGKSSTLYLPQLLSISQWPPFQRPQLVVADPKHELLALTGSRLKALGYNVHAVIFDDPTLSDNWNPLQGLDGGDLEIDHSAVWEVVDAIVPQGHEPDPYWIQSARLLLFASIIGVKYAHGKLASLAEAIAWAFRPEETLAFLKQRDPSVSFLLGGLMKNLEENPKALGTILSELPGRLATWMAPPLLALYRPTLWDFTRLWSDGDLHAVFISATPEQQPLAQLAWRQCLSGLRKAQQSIGRLSRPAWLLLDEIGNLGRIPGLAQGVTTLAGAGVSIMAGLQSLAQLTAIYGAAEAEVILSNLPLRVVLPGVDAETGQWMSRHVGIGTVTTTAKQRAADGSVSWSTSTSARSVLTPDEIGRLDSRSLLVQRLGMSATLLRQRPYYHVKVWQDVAAVANPSRPRIVEALDEWRHNPLTPPNLAELAVPLNAMRGVVEERRKALRLQRPSPSRSDQPS